MAPMAAVSFSRLAGLGAVGPGSNSLYCGSWCPGIARVVAMAAWLMLTTPRPLTSANSTIQGISRALLMIVVDDNLRFARQRVVTK